MNKSPFICSIIAGMVSSIVLTGMAIPQTINADLQNSKTELSIATLVNNGHLTICKIDKSSYQVVKTLKMIITAYSSSPDETTGIPNKPGIITASGKYVADGIVASNILPFGTKVRIPRLGNKIFTVEDRMHPRKKGIVDIWMPTKQEAKNFGVKLADIEVLEN